MATFNLNAAIVSGIVHADDAANVARIVAGVSTGIDPVTKRSLADIAASLPSYAGRPGDMPREGDKFPIDPNLTPMRGTDGKWRNCRAIRFATDRTDAIVGYFPCDKGKGFAKSLDSFKAFVGIVADSHAGQNTKNHDANLAKIQKRTANVAAASEAGIDPATLKRDGTPRRPSGRKGKGKQTDATNVASEPKPHVDPVDNGTGIESTEA